LALRIFWLQHFAFILNQAKIRKKLGPHGYDPLLLFKCLLLGLWHGLSDRQLEESLKIRLDFMLFAGLDLHSKIPGETIHCRFRNLLEQSAIRWRHLVATFYGKNKTL